MFFVQITCICSYCTAKSTKNGGRERYSISNVFQQIPISVNITVELSSQLGTAHMYDAYQVNICIG